MIEELEPEQLRELLQSGKENLELIDVRETYEYQQFHLTDSKLIPLASLMGRLGEIDWEKKVVFVCRSGNRSGMAARSLEAQMGKKSANLKYGLQVCLAQGGSEFLEVAGELSHH